MKRRDFYKKMNCNNSLFNNINRNVLDPEIFVRQIWLNDDVDDVGVEIIELNTSKETKSSPDETIETKNIKHGWSYTKDGAFQHDRDYAINSKAREKRRYNSKNQQFTRNMTVNTNNEHDNNFETNYVYTDTCDEKYIDAKTNHRENSCFTIINKHFIDSGSSSDYDYTHHIDTVDCSDTEQYEWKDYAKGDEKSYEERNANYDRNTEKQTIWIYSFKNQPLLIDNDFELLNIPRKSSSSSTSYSTEETKGTSDYKQEEIANCRVATPIPPEYIPDTKLTLSSSLPIITEITESVTPPANPNENHKENSIAKTQLSVNSWMVNQNSNENSVRNIKTEDKSTNIVNWMLLSPRERRRYLNTHFEIHQHHYTQLPTVEEELLIEEAKLQEIKLTSTETQVDLNVIFLDNVTDEESNMPSKNSAKKANVDIQVEDQISFPAVEESHQEGRGDHNKRNPKLKIKLSPERTKSAPNITDPIENLESNNWISEEKLEAPIAIHNYKDIEEIKVENTENTEIGIDSAGNKLLMRNITLLKPAKWSEYLPIVGTPPSLHLSWDSTSDKETRSLCKRFINFFHCCTKT